MRGLITFIRNLAAQSRLPDYVFGDVPYVPEEMRAATRKARGGEAASGSGSRPNKDVIARRHVGINTQ